MMKPKGLTKLMLLLVSVLVLSSFSGGKAQPEKKVVEVRFWHVFSENFGAPVIKEMVAAINDSQSEIKVTEVYNPDMYPGLMQNLQVGVAAGEVLFSAIIGYKYQVFC